MKRVFASFSIAIVGLFSFSVNAAVAKTAKDFSLACSNSAAGIVLYAEGTKFHFHLEDGIGFANFPIYSGTVTPAMLPLVERGAKDLAAFDREVDITWDVSQCKVDEKRPYLVSCSNRGEILTPANVAIQASSMETTTSKIDGLDAQADVVDINLGLTTTGSNFVYYFVSFPFDMHHCSVRPAGANSLNQSSGLPPVGVSLGQLPSIQVQPSVGGAKHTVIH